MSLWLSGLVCAPALWGRPTQRWTLMSQAYSYFLLLACVCVCARVFCAHVLVHTQQCWVCVWGVLPALYSGITPGGVQGDHNGMPGMKPGLEASALPAGLSLWPPDSHLQPPSAPHHCTFRLEQLCARPSLVRDEQPTRGKDCPSVQTTGTVLRAEKI